MTVQPARDATGKMVAGRTAYLILHNTSEVVTPNSQGSGIDRYRKGAVVFQDGRVVEIGPAAELLRRHSEARPMNAHGRLVTPGLVDAHTHMLFAGNRALEHDRRQRGEDYASIAREGGGIRVTVRDTVAAREAPSTREGQLLEKSLANRLERWRACGVTTVEVKSGYGESPEGEVKMLETLRNAAQRVPVRVPRTALLLHALPEDYVEDREGFLEEVVTHTLKTIKIRDLAAAIDAFCDDIAFSVEECRRVLVAAKAMGFDIKLHADQLERNGGALLAAELGARSADHLECATEDDWRALAAAGTVGVLLPAAAMTLRLPLPRAEMLRASGARFAIATDFNPGTAPAQSLLECAALASRQCGFTAEESLLAVTWNAAKALGVEAEVGHLNPGASGDAVTWECETLEELPYWMPAVRPDCVFVRGADLALPALEGRVWP